jgi:hypothetical protein
MLLCKMDGRNLSIWPIKFKMISHSPIIPFNLIFSKISPNIEITVFALRLSIFFSTEVKSMCSVDLEVIFAGIVCGSGLVSAPESAAGGSLANDPLPSTKSSGSGGLGSGTCCGRILTKWLECDGSGSDSCVAFGGWGGGARRNSVVIGRSESRDSEWFDSGEGGSGDFGLGSTLAGEPYDGVVLLTTVV